MYRYNTHILVYNVYVQYIDIRNVYVQYIYIYDHAMCMYNMYIYIYIYIYTYMKAIKELYEVGFDKMCVCERETIQIQLQYAHI